ncbi:hypothetical protein E5288_WYG006371 [Bos mutus]|uniref:Uncharacterized protein n=1 Tax=Bos mutus TaxID=72004 RepID=A0A6B0QUD3_9CETA|nr:hypothetical protein [Bos mutus]
MGCAKSKEGRAAERKAKRKSDRGGRTAEDGLGLEGALSERTSKTLVKRRKIGHHGPTLKLTVKPYLNRTVIQSLF